MNKPDALRTLGRLIADRQDALLDAQNPDEAMRQYLAHHTAAQRRSRRLGALTARPWLAAALAIAAVFALVGGAVWKAKSSDRLLTFSVGDPEAPGTAGELAEAPADKDLRIRFSEGTIVVLRPGARGRIVNVGPRGAELALESGRARLEVIPRPEGDWSVRAGAFAVRITGTKFEIGYEPPSDDFWLELYEGRVMVSGCRFGQGRMVEAGERATASCSRQELSVVSRRDSDQEAKPAQTQEAKPPAATGPTEPGKGAAISKSRAAPRSWLELAHEGRYDDAFELARDRFEEECRLRGPAEVALLGDVARLSGHTAHARRAYIAVRERFPSTSEAALSAFALGRVALGDSDRVGAQTWLETYLHERPTGSLAPAALGRLMELGVERGDARASEVLAREYLQRYPTGAHAAEAQKVLAAHGADPR